MKTGWILCLIALASCASTVDVQDGGRQPALVGAPQQPADREDGPVRLSYGQDGFQAQKRSLDTGESFSRELKVLFLEQDFRWEARALNERLKRETQLTYHGLFLGAQDGWKQPTSRDRKDIRSLTAEFVKPGGALRSDAMFAEYDFDVVIVGDVMGGEAGLDSDAWLVLENFVIDGGGLILLPGMRSMPSAHWTTPAFARLSPVASSGEEAAVDARAEKCWGITEDGWTSGLFAISKDAKRDRELWGEENDGFQRGLLSGHLWYFDAVRLRERAEVLARSVETGGKVSGGKPLVVSRELGRGRVLWVGTDDWSRLREFVGDTYYAAVWANFINWAAGDAKD